MPGGRRTPVSVFGDEIKDPYKIAKGIAVSSGALIPEFARQTLCLSVGYVSVEVGIEISVLRVRPFVFIIICLFSLSFWC
jgi:hypothetical protein